MDTSTIFSKYEQHTGTWIIALDEYDRVTFCTRPSAEEWCMAQVYDHLIAVSKECIQRAQDCIHNKGEKGHSGFGPALFSLMGAFPPVKLRIKEPPVGLEHVYRPRNINVSEARQGLNEVLGEMKTLATFIPAADPQMRIKHWAGGWFNAAQWYHSAEMHLKHHFRQKRRIDRYLERMHSVTAP